MRSQRKSGDEKAPSHNTVSVWTRAFLPKMPEHVSKWAPSTSQTWSMNDLHMKPRRVAHYLYMIMDHDARFVLAHDMGDTKAADDAAPVAGEAKQRAGDVPGIVLRDGAANPSKAIKTTNTITREGAKKRTRQATARLRGNAAGLRHERLNRTAGERLRPPGTIKEKGSKLIAGFLMFCNFIRRHMGLGGKAPAEAAGFARCAQPVGRARTQRVLGSRDRVAVARDARKPPPDTARRSAKSRKFAAARRATDICVALIENFSSCHVGDSAVAWQTNRLHYPCGHYISERGRAVWASTACPHRRHR